MIQTPKMAIKAPIISYFVGVYLSNTKAHKRDKAIKKPPYVAYTFAKLEACKVATSPYSTNIRAPNIPYHNGLPPFTDSHMRYPPPISHKPAMINIRMDFSIATSLFFY